MSETELKRKLMKIPTALQGRRAAEVVRALDTTKASDAKAPKARRPKKARAGAARSRLEFDAPEVTAPEKKAPAVETAQPFEPDFSRGDSLQLYLREIGQVKLLTPAEEIALAKRIKRGDKSAREHMIKANLRLVVKIARDYENLGLPLLDLINEGNIGLMKGVERFDPKKGAKLSTYASWWIKQAIKRALANQSKTIRLPVHVVDKVAHIRRAEVRLREVLDREPTDEEVASELGLDARRVRRYRAASRAPVSLDAPIGDDDTDRVSEVVADPNAALPSEQLVYESDNALVQEILATLPEREREILAMRFGLSDGKERTLEEVGERFGVTRERIRQIQEQALKTIRKTMEKRDRPSEELESLAVAG
jgi:RNA polymerase primary sigma factor